MLWEHELPSQKATRHSQNQTAVANLVSFPLQIQWKALISQVLITTVTCTDAAADANTKLQLRINVLSVRCLYVTFSSAVSTVARISEEQSEARIPMGEKDLSSLLQNIHTGGAQTTSYCRKWVVKTYINTFTWYLIASDGG